MSDTKTVTINDLDRVATRGEQLEQAGDYTAAAAVADELLEMIPYCDDLPEYKKAMAIVFANGIKDAMKAKAKSSEGLAA